MEKINLILKNIGLTDTETNIYLTGLQYSSIGVNRLEKETKIKRTTIYHAINTLSKKGLVSKKDTGAKLVFMMTRPENIQRLLNKEIEILENQKTELDEIIPLLNQHQQKEEANFNVAHFDGIEGIKLVIEEALYCKSRHWDVIAPPKNFFSDFDKKYAEYFMNTRKRKKISARSLWESKADKKVLTPEDLKQRQPRILPNIMYGKFKSIIIIFDDKVAIISSLKESSAILIQSREVHDTMLALFDGLWHISKEY
ncbi:hypothetical protein A2331_07035 [Candidatus Falkowbacteria bacterium RIFOXYB2_FULL_34_18]|uniref:Transcription regulator TrmB N-terminal domain-containing protein n=1 Tax=Candidatus Falkowbacteria bacterium RIFOXYD2_FULL_34_120 TaxID=1798007 RepID=A0A1F5TRH2_9BACT|nr:MAG: hypothetical protein A2331_07035 [Candidatus Falkowbacteria bacterium RIFOXYB2_FULL_34_18]OGF29925.1 MAG: hypothetical protein A2500_03640 [Candidatus Falkowbacteria bacterium RIFOXYC12_FULL_34_55]OGF37217.1 MAG: hypothetical protein A2466_02875 [Candidatus Falkowbacteria bacterium RIFOXYC2_FULL_34_220]OGF39463.1 MAG: hypothetical protein A2515_04015 [Candidatus Falkowbacteria bacterium RIFOXYD12_FULL_34_57]OGF41555.1 MAG: hypothetical protein A2531_02590 [Candidatus Falkowbacteria bact